MIVIPEGSELESTFLFEEPHEKPGNCAALVRNVDTGRSYIGYGDSEEDAVIHALNQIENHDH